LGVQEEVQREVDLVAAQRPEVQAARQLEGQMEDPEKHLQSTDLEGAHPIVQQVQEQNPTW
jgi:hypothetical protein